MSDARRFDRQRDILVRALQLSESARMAYLDRECAGDAEFRRDVEALLGVDPDRALPAFARTGGARGLSGGPGGGLLADPLPHPVGGFEVLGVLGRGGMGIVLRARDTRLGRDVALKILPQAFAGKPERLARFRREAKLVAALNHPHIAQIYGLEESGAVNALVMELVEGMTLAERIATSPPNLSEALGIARQIAAAIEAAHEQGIVHRDLKPANVMVTARGVVKILDFGIAKALDPGTGEGANDPGSDDSAGSSERFHTLVLGTPAYMSPEQFRRQPVTRRVDVWAFGCVFFELLSGRPAFDRSNVPDTMAAVLTADPDWSLLPKTTPPSLRQLLSRCLHRDDSERLHDIGDVRILLDDIIRDQNAPPLGGVPVKSWWRSRWAVAVASLVAGLAAGLVAAGWYYAKSSVPIRTRALTTSGHDNLPVVSPDRRFLAFVSDRDDRSRIWLKNLATGTEWGITEGDDTLPQFSPDGEELLFVRIEDGHQNLYRQALMGGHPRKVLGDVLEACWSPEGDRIAFIRLRKGAGGIVATIPAMGGPETKLFESDRQLYGARWSPRGDEIVTVEGPATGNVTEYNLVFIDPGGESDVHSPRRLTVSGPRISAPAWAGPGRQLLYAQAGNLVGDYGDPAAPILLHDLDTDRVRPVFFAPGLFPSLAQWSIGRGTSIGIVAPGSVVFGSTQSKQGLRESALKGDSPRDLPQGGRRDRQPVYSPDGKRLLFSSDRTGNLDLWLFDLEHDSLSQLTNDPEQDWDPAFMPDGKHVIWSSDRAGHLEIWTMNLDGSESRQVTQDGEDAENPTATADGRWIIYVSSNRDKAGIWKIRSDGTAATRLVAGRFSVPDTSPDGRWAGFLEQQPHARHTVIRVLEIATGKIQPFEITVRWPHVRPERFVFGRMRWAPDSRAIAYVGVNNRSHAGIYVQDYDPIRNTDATRRPLTGFRDGPEAESFSLSPEGRYIAISAMEREQSIQMAERVPGVEPPQKRDIDGRGAHHKDAARRPRF